MTSFEKEIKKKREKGEKVEGKMNLSMVRYFWQASPFVRNKMTIPNFLRKVHVLKDFSDNELRILSKYLHRRVFISDEIIFDRNDLGIGFYFVYQGTVDIIVEGSNGVNAEGRLDDDGNLLLTLERYNYFGELALLQEQGLRNATAAAKNGCELLGFFKPDLEDLINERPIVAAKLLRSVSMILANRLYHLTDQLKDLKLKLSKYES